MLRSVFIWIILCGFAPVAAAAEIVRQKIPQAEVVGEATFTYAIWDVYDATLFAPKGTLRFDAPHALSLRYRMEFDGSDIAERSVEEMRDQGFTDEVKLSEWHGAMNAIFPDVQEGTVLSAVFIPGAQTEFYQENTPIGVIKDAEFTRQFANIWLGEKTSEPELRKKLLGLL